MDPGAAVGKPRLRFEDEWGAAVNDDLVHASSPCLVGLRRSLARSGSEKLTSPIHIGAEPQRALSAYMAILRAISSNRASGTLTRRLPAPRLVVVRTSP